MIRIFVENLVLFLLPAAVYFAYMYLARDEHGNRTTSTMSEAPLLWLFGAGALLLLATLLIFGSTQGGKPGQSYEPAILKDGKIEPGHVR